MEGCQKGASLREWLRPITPRVQGREEGVQRHHMQKRRSRADRWWEARCRQGVNRPGGASERSTAGEAVQLLKAGGTQNLRSRCDRHGWKRLRTGVPCARRMLPLESRMREIRTSGSVSRGWKRTYDDGLTHRRESGRKTLRTLRAPRHLLTLQGVFQVGVFEWVTDTEIRVWHYIPGFLRLIPGSDDQLLDASGSGIEAERLVDPAFVGARRV